MLKSDFVSKKNKCDLEKIKNTGETFVCGGCGTEDGVTTNTESQVHKFCGKDINVAKTQVRLQTIEAEGDKIGIKVVKVKVEKKIQYSCPSLNPSSPGTLHTALHLNADFARF